MGLDMYLTARKFLWTSWEGQDRTKDDDVADAIRQLLPEAAGLKPRYVEVEAMYWRKANAIHRWFVENVQKGEDDCGTYVVGREQLAELADLCEAVLANPGSASNLLPTSSGFFFGGTDYDQYYLDDCRETAEGIRKLLANPGLEEGYWEFQYHSSW
jgi:hypothetical protein